MAPEGFSPSAGRCSCASHVPSHHSPLRDLSDCHTDFPHVTCTWQAGTRPMEMTHKLEGARLQHPALLLPCCWSRFLTHHLRWAGSGHAPALCLLLAPMARCWFFTTDNNHVSKALVKVGSRAPPPCWGRTSRRGSPMRSTGCTVCLACVPWVLQLPEPGSGEQLEEAPWGCPPALPVLPPSTTACASTQCWPLLPRLTSEQTNGFSCSEAEVYPKCGRAETGTGRSGAGGRAGLGAPVGPKEPRR